MSRIGGLLKRYRVALDAANERVARSQRSAKDEILDLAEEMVPGCVNGLLEDLGQRPAVELSLDARIANVGAAIFEHRQHFKKDAPIESLAQGIHDLRQVIRDIGYLREGFGRGSGRPQPEDMKWVHPHAVVSEVLYTMSSIAEALQSEGAQVERLSPEIEVEAATIREGVIALLRRSFDAQTFMHAAIDLGVSQTGPAGWDRFLDLPFEAELEEQRDFLADVVKANPSTVPLLGFFFEIAHPSREGETVADLWVSGASHYEPNDEGWFAHIDYTPSGGKLESKVLASIYRLAYAPGGLGNAAEYTLCLAWSAFFARECMRRYVDVMRSGPVGCRVGFSGGDWMELGWIGSNLIARE